MKAALSEAGEKTINCKYVKKRVKADRFATFASQNFEACIFRLRPEMKGDGICDA
jgi:hypothetical protein